MWITVEPRVSEAPSGPGNDVRLRMVSTMRGSSLILSQISIGNYTVREVLMKNCMRVFQ